MLLSRSDAEAIMKRALALSSADETEVTLGGNDERNLRFAVNEPTTNGSSSGLSLGVTCVFGKRVGSSRTTQLDEESIRTVVHRAEELARLAPENPEYMPRLGPQTYRTASRAVRSADGDRRALPLSPQWSDEVAELTTESHARIASEAIEAARAQELQAAGFISSGSGFSAMMNSKGLSAYHPSTGASYSLTVRHGDGNGSGWAAREDYRGFGLEVDGDLYELATVPRAIDKAVRSRNPEPIEPGSYPVVLEPSAVGDMLNLLSWSLDRREAEEGRSYFSKGEGTTRIGEKLFDDRVTIASDPTDPVAPSTPWGDDGQALQPTTWIERGVLKNLPAGRYWAARQGYAPLPFGSNLLMEGEDHTIADLIASTERGLLVTSFWYIRAVDPRTILYTGLTRDGLFLIENGKITRPVVNMRWNESPIAVLKGVEMMSRPARVVTREGNAPMTAPALKVKGFTFTSVSPST